MCVWMKRSIYRHLADGRIQIVPAILSNNVITNMYLKLIVIIDILLNQRYLLYIISKKIAFVVLLDRIGLNCGNKYNRKSSGNIYTIHN